MFKDTSAVVGHFMSNPVEREKGIEELVEERKEMNRGEEGKLNDSADIEEILIWQLLRYSDSLGKVRCT